MADGNTLTLRDIANAAYKIKNEGTNNSLSKSVRILETMVSEFSI